MTADDTAVLPSADTVERQNGTAARYPETLSPELALVDPRLGARARAALRRPPDTLETIQHLVRMRRAATLAARVGDDPLVHFAPGRLRWLHPFGRVRRRVLVVGATVAVSMAALMLGVRVDLSGTPAGAEPEGTRDPTAVSSGTETQTVRPSGAPTAPVPSRDSEHETLQQPRRFAWAPVEGASGYHVELFRGATLVLARQTVDPDVVIAPRWRFAGKVEEFEPGFYRWYVWPVVSGLRASQAIVQARLDIPG
jgi:hypothetical protein